MPRIARVVIPEYPHHVIHRGNRREKVFFSDEDKQSYLNYLRKCAKEAGVEFWGYCLMDNHVHFIVVPKKEDSLARCFKEAHKQYTRMINFRQNWRGHLWEGRFKSCVLSEKHLYAALRHVEINPVRARIAKKAEDYPWSSAKAHVYKERDALLSDNFVIQEISDWAGYLADGDNREDIDLFTRYTEVGRPLGDGDFIEKIEKVTGRFLRKNKPGPKR